MIFIKAPYHPSLRNNSEKNYSASRIVQFMEKKTLEVEYDYFGLIYKILHLSKQYAFSSNFIPDFIIGNAFQLPSSVLAE